jgi:hypothetical protein
MKILCSVLVALALSFSVSAQAQGPERPMEPSMPAAMPGGAQDSLQAPAKQLPAIATNKMHRGSVMEAGRIDRYNQVPFYVTTSCKFCTVGQTVQIWFESLRQEDNVSVTVTESFYGEGGSRVPLWTRALSTSGQMDSGFGYFTTIGIYQSKIVAQDTLGFDQFGEYSFAVEFYGQGGRVLQTTNLTVYNFVTPPEGETGPIVIDSITMTPYLYGSQMITAHGKFPKYRPMFAWMGIFAMEGGFTSAPSYISYDGVTVQLMAIGGQPGPTHFRGGVVLMTEDGRYSSVLPDCFSF